MTGSESFEPNTLPTAGAAGSDSSVGLGHGSGDNNEHQHVPAKRKASDRQGNGRNTASCTGEFIRVYANGGFPFSFGRSLTEMCILLDSFSVQTGQGELHHF
jgi:hypothetical protein